MNELKEKKDSRNYQDWIQSLDFSNGRLKDDPLRSVRAQAFERFKKLGFPTRKTEAWKYMSLEPVLKTVFTPPQPRTGNPDQLKKYFFQDENRLVFINGRYSSEFSVTQNKIEIEALSSVLAKRPDEIKKYLPENFENESNAFTAINAFSFEEGAFIRIPAESSFEKPFHLLFVNYGDSKAPEVFYPRIIVVVGKGASANLLIQSMGVSAGPYLMNGFAEFFLGENAKIHCTHLQREEGGALKVFTARAKQQAGSHFEWVSFSHGGSSLRNEIISELEGENAFSFSAGLSVLSGASQVFHHAEVQHRVPRGTSRQLYKNILAGKSQAEFDSLVHVWRGAHHSDSQQLDRNLLLSDFARAYSRPQLKIDADEVQANHGAATGQLQKDELFYLRSRGLDKDMARFILIRGVAEEVIQKIKCPAVRQEVENFLREKLEKILSGQEEKC